ncbi:hypothetical protein [Clostridium sp. B9]|uniref:hypothetical protein n=1 Tax=Clostridium sp. B9 TaxID=3423224 RepID=UPI003D2EBB05
MTSTRRPIYNCDVLITNGKYFYKVFSDFSGLAKLSIPWGKYWIKISNPGYKSVYNEVLICSRLSFNEFILEKKQIINYKRTEEEKEFGTVVGKIIARDDGDLIGAKVILFRVNNDNSLDPVDYIYTDKYGNYDFSRVKSGKYVIKVMK